MKNRLLIISICILFITSICYFNATYINPRQLVTREEIIKSNKVSEDLNGMMLAYFSDLQYGNLTTESDLERLKNTINAFKPDIIVFGGDLCNKDQKIDDNVKGILINFLQSLEAKYGKYAVLGDQDITNKEAVETILLEADFVNIGNSSNPIVIRKNESINLIGIAADSSDNQLISTLFHGINSSCYTFVISHYPDRFNDIINQNFDYCLSGHSLGGQIYLPIINLFNRPDGAREYYRGKITRNGKTLDITNGIGYQKRKVRFMADPEVVFYRLDSLSAE